MYDKIAQMCDEKLDEIGIKLNDLDVESRRLNLERDFLIKLRSMLQDVTEITNLDEGMSTARRTINDEDPNEPELLKIIRKNPGLSTQEISERVGINGQSLSNRLGDLQRQDRIGNGGTKRPNGARWFAK